MKKRNLFAKLISFILCITIISPTVVHATSIGNTDTISGHWAEETLTYWNMLGLFDEIPDDEFGIDKSITRGAFVYIFNTMLSIQQPENTKNIFTDITESDWNYDDIVTAYSIGYISGYPNNTFRADSLITREEMCTVISRYFGLDKVYNDNKLQSFTDKEKIQSYALDHIGALAELETVNGYPNGSFKPQNNITYAETVTIITRFLSYINGGSGISGRVYYEDKPVYNATISIFENDTSSVVAESMSDPYGDYIIDVPAGTYDVTFTKDGTVYMLADVEITDNVRTYNKIELETGEYVTGTIVDENGKPIEGKALYIQGDSCVVVETDENGVFSVILPQNKNYTLGADVDGTIWKLVAFETQSFEDGLDLGKITLTTGEVIKAEQKKITPPYWFLDQYIRDMLDKDDDKDDKKDENNNEDIYPDYSYLPYREPKTMEELVEINGGEQPEIVVDENGRVIRYSGKFTNVKIENAEQAITELNNLSNILNLEDARKEFVLKYEADTNWIFTQIYNGVPVNASQVEISNNGITSTYHPDIRYNISLPFSSISYDDAADIIEKHYKKELGVSVDILESDLVIYDEYEFLIYKFITCDDEGNEYSAVMNAENGEIIYWYKIRTSVSDDLFNIDQTDKNYSPYTIYLDGYGTNVLAAGARRLPGLFNSDTYYLFEISKNRIGIYDYVDNHIYSHISNVFPDDENGINEEGIYGLYNFNLLLNSLNNIVNWRYDFDEGKTKFALRLNYNGSSAYYGYWFDYDKKSIEFVFNKNNGYSKVYQFDTIGHEYTHFIQDYFIGNKIGIIGDSLGESEVQTSKDMNWVESLAISEGTADILGMLLEAAIENPEKNLKDITAEDFLTFGESKVDKDPVRIHTSSNEEGNQTVSEMYERYSSNDLEVVTFHVVKDFKNYNAGNNIIINASESERDKYQNLIDRGFITNYPDFENIFHTSDNLPYSLGPGHEDGYIVAGILRNMIENGSRDLCDIETQIKLWFSTIQKLTTKSTLLELREKLIQTAIDMGFSKETIVDIKKSINSVGIISTSINNNSNMWYTTSMNEIHSWGILNSLSDDNDEINPTDVITQLEYIQLVVDFCNKAGANLSVTYHETNTDKLKAVYKISSDQSMSLMFDESKDILRWEAYIITYSILNYCHLALKKNDFSVQYNYPYLDTTTKDKVENYATFIKQLGDSENDIKKGLPDISANDVLKRYYNGMSYNQFHEQYMYTKNQNGTVNYDFSNDSYQFTDGQRVVLDSMYNIYMSLGKKITPITRSNSSQFNVCEPMTLATACYLLYAYIQK